MKEIIRKYTNNADTTKYKYLFIKFDDRKGHGPGLCDQLFQVKLYLKIAYELGLTLILPERNLHPRHNSGRIVSGKLSEFYDINCIKIDGNIVSVMESREGLNSSEVLMLDAVERKNGIDHVLEFTKQLDYTVDFVRAKKDVHLANSVINDRKIQGCVHIRRGDRLVAGNGGISGEEVDQATKAKQIIHLLDSTKAPQVIYIMSDMLSDDDNIKELNMCDRYKFVFIYDIPWLYQLKIDNNYKAFNIESAIQESSKLSYVKNKHAVINFWKRENKI